MEKNFTADEIRRAKEVHLYDGDTLYVVDADDEAYGFYRYGGTWYHKSNFWDYFESETMMSYFAPITKDEAAVLYESWCERLKTANARLNQAICFATERHAGQTRKGTTLPYILHPLEVLQILYSMRADTEVLIAGVLHDTVEDTDTSMEEIRARFGDDVAELVASNSEDKSKTWDERKRHTIETLSSAPHRVKQLILADKLANLRSIAHDYKNLGDQLWSRFNAPAEKQAWYYGGIDDALSTLQYHGDCADLYWEFNRLFKDVFVKYYLDEENNVLHQVCRSGEHYCLQKSLPEFWDTYADFLAQAISEQAKDGTHRFYRTEFSAEGLTEITRRQAEQMEDKWCDEFQICG